MFEDVLLSIYSKFWSGNRVFISRTVAKDVAFGKESYLLLGPRRSGKSTLLYDIYNLHLKEGYNKEDFIFINFEDPKLINFKFDNLDSILITYNSLYPNKRPILLLDEIQYIEHWERFVRSLVDNQYRVFVTGSNSEMLNNKSKSLLGARVIKKNIYPVDFLEYLYFKGISKEQIKIQSSSNMLNLFNEYFNFGGFPEIILSDKKEDLLNTYFELSISDILRYNSDFKELELKLLIKKIRENITNEVTINSYNNFFESINYKIDKNKVYDYFKNLEENFIILSITQYKKSMRVRSYGKKTYLIDMGYISLFDIKDDFGLKLENLVFLELFKRNNEIYYYKENLECDFIVKSKTKLLFAIQVTYELNDGNQDREIKGILSAMDTLNLNSGLILTYNQDKIIKQNNKIIIVKPIWKWLLEN